MPMRPVPIHQIVDEYIQLVQSGEDPERKKRRPDTSQPSEEFVDGCPNSISLSDCGEKNRGLLIDGLGSSAAADECIAAQRKICFGHLGDDGKNFRPGQLCGVRVKCL